MAITATTEWRIRTGGNDANGAAYDSAQSGVISTTLNGAITNSATSITVASASGWPSSGNYYARIGATGAEGTDGLNEIVLVTGGQGTTTWTVTRGQLGTSGKAFATGVVVDNNLARCDTAAWSGTDGTSNASTTFTSASATFNETVVGNYLRLASGTNVTVGYYRITGYTDANTITLDRNCSTAAMTDGAWKIGGAGANLNTADLFNSSKGTGNKCVAGNDIYIRGAGTRNPSAQDYFFTNEFSVVNGDTTSGPIRLIGEYGRPRLEANSRCNFNGSYNICISLYVVRTAVGVNATYSFLSGFDFIDCVYDLANGNYAGMTYGLFAINCHIRGNSSKPSSSSSYLLVSGSVRNSFIFGCTVENSRSDGISSQESVLYCVIRNCLGNGISRGATSEDASRLICGNIITGNDGHGISVTNTSTFHRLSIVNNIIANHTAAGKYGINCSTDLTKWSRFDNYNAFYNNTGNYNNTSSGPNDIACTADPFTNAAGGDYTLNNTAGGGKELRDAGLPGVMPGLSTTDVYSPIGLLGTPAAFIAPSGLIARNIGTY